MANNNNYGVNKVGTDLWVKNEMPLELGTEQEAINNWSFAEAITVSNYLTDEGTEGESYAPGRPIRKPRP